jgi:hypothetical protein
MEANQRPELEPAEYLRNFGRLCQSNGIQNSDSLFRILRECYTNPLCYLGPPKNLPDDYAKFSQPLTVSKESWKVKRIHSLEAKVCARCGGKGHTPANCTGAIKCSRCGEQGHALKDCKKKAPQNEIKMDGENIDSKSIKSHRNARKRKPNKKKSAPLPKKNK